MSDATVCRQQEASRSTYDCTYLLEEFKLHGTSKQPDLQTWIHAASSGFGFDGLQLLVH